MQLKKVLPYNIKRNVRRAVLATGLAGATLVGCKDKIEPTIEPTRDVELKFKIGCYDEIEPANIKKHLRDKSVRHIYMVPINGGGFYWDNPGALTNVCDALEERIQIDPDMISGKEDLGFIPGVVTPTDSLRFLEMGFTVNQKKHR